MKNPLKHHPASFNISNPCPEILTQTESDRILQFSKNYSTRDFTMISLALFTGLRNSEVVNLTIFCIAPYNQIIDQLEVPGTIAKGNKARTIPVHPDLLVILTNWLKWKVDHDELTTLRSPLFLSSRTKNKLSQRDFQRILNQISIKAIGRAIHPHVLRHTFATRLLAKSNIRVVQKLLGHANIQTTQIYTHPNNDDCSSAIDQI